MRILIAGCGDLGTETGLRFADAGHAVVGLRRRPEKLPPALVGLRADLAAGHLDELPDDVEVVIYAAAAGARSEAAYLGTYLAGPGHVLDALARVRARPRRFVYVSSTAVYGDHDGGWVDEDTTPRPANVTAEVLLASEQSVLERAPDPIVVRLSGIYGPGRTRQIDAVRGGTAVVPEQPHYTNRIHRDDAAAVLVHLATRREPTSHCYLGTDHEPADLGEVLRFLAEQLRLPPPPTGPVRASRGGAKRCRNDRLVSTGFRFTYPTFREGYQAVLAGDGVRHP